MLDAKSHFDRIGADLPGDAALRQATFAAAEARGMPTRRQEAWHYTDVTRLLKRPADDRLDAVNFLAVDPLMAVFDNGEFVEIPQAEGLSLHDFENASAENDAVLDYNAAFAQGGLNAEISGILAQPLIVTNAGSDPVHLHHKIKLANGAKAVLVDNHLTTAYANVRFDIDLGDGAELTLIRLQQAGHQIGTSQISLAAKAQFKSVALVTGGALARHEARVKLHAAGAHAELHSAVLGRGENHADFTYEIDHQQL